MMRSDGRPAVRYRVRGFAALDDGGPVPTPPGAQQCLALRVKTRQGVGTGEPGEMIAALAVFRLVIDHFIVEFHLADAEVTLKIGGVVLGVPQAEFDR